MNTEWNLKRLEQLIKNEAQENLNLEFKRSEALEKTDTKKKEISKDVSALANSDGGVIVYGIIEENHKALSLDNGSNGKDITKEWIEQVINSTIQKRIQGIVIEPIYIDKAKNRQAWVITVPKSNTAPHQAIDKRFYKRFNFQSVPMEGYEIEDVRTRVITPELRLSLDIAENRFTTEQGKDNTSSLKLKAQIHNDSTTPAKYVRIELFLDKRVRILKYGDLQFSRGAQISVGDTRIECNALTLNWSVPHNMPIWAEQSFDISDLIEIAFPADGNGAAYVVHYRVSSPGMKTKQQTKVIYQGSSYITFSDFIEDQEELADKLGF